MPAPSRLELPITRVTVHRDGAIVVRRGAVTPSGGRARIGRLPLLLDEGSLRVRVDGGALREVRLELDAEGLDRGERPEAEAAVREAEREVARIDAVLGVLRAQRERVARLAPGGPDPRRDDAPPDAERVRDWAAFEAAVDGWAADLDARIGALADARRRAVEALDVGRATLAHTSHTAAFLHFAPTRIAVLGVESDGPVEVTLSYRVDGACWTPRYALHADGALRRARFTVGALVAQATGEDWAGVALTLSTAPCQRAIDVPDLPALRLGKARAPAPSPWRELPEGLDAMFPDELAPAPEPPAAFHAHDEAAAEVSLDDLVPEPPPRALPAKTAAFARRMRPSGANAPQAAAPLPPPALAPPAAPPPAEPPGDVDVAEDVLDYPQLRLAGFDAPPGVRGRLARVSLAAAARDAGLPDDAARALAETWAQRRARAEAVLSRPLPAHHALPGAYDGGDFAFSVDSPADVPGDGRLHPIAVEVADVALDVTYRTVPRLDPRVFRTARCVLSRPAPLLPGPVDVHVDGALVLTAPWRGAARGGELVIGLGVEEGVRVARNTRYREETAGIFGNDRRLHTEIEVQLASSLSRAARVEILDRVPVSRDDDVRFDVAGATPAAEPWTGEDGGPIVEGGRRQVVELAPGAVAVTRLHYVTNLSGRTEIIGGDRRG